MKETTPPLQIEQPTTDYTNLNEYPHIPTSVPPHISPPAPQYHR